MWFWIVYSLPACVYCRTGSGLNYSKCKCCIKLRRHPCLFIWSIVNIKTVWGLQTLTDNITRWREKRRTAPGWTYSSFHRKESPLIKNSFELIKTLQTAFHLRSMDGATSSLSYFLDSSLKRATTYSNIIIYVHIFFASLCLTSFPPHATDRHNAHLTLLLLPPCCCSCWCFPPHLSPVFLSCTYTTLLLCHPSLSAIHLFLLLFFGQRAEQRGGERAAGSRPLPTTSL